MFFERSYPVKTRMTNPIIRRIAALALALVLVVGTFAAAPAARSEAASSNQEQIYTILTDELGFNVAAATGIMANIYCESTFRPTAYNPAGSYGLCQWLGGRLHNLRSWCSSNGYDYSSIEGQLHFLDHELENGYSSVYDHLMNVEESAEGARDAAAYWTIHFEKPANMRSVAVRRGNIAVSRFWSTYQDDVKKDEWVEEDGVRYFELKDGSRKSGWFEQDGKTWYLDPEQGGAMITGWKTIDGKTYYFGSDGVRTTGTVTVEGRTCRFDDEDGHLISGWIEIDGKWCFLDADGKLESESILRNAQSRENSDADEEESVTAATTSTAADKIQAAKSGASAAAAATTAQSAAADASTQKRASFADVDAPDTESAIVSSTTAAADAQ